MRLLARPIPEDDTEVVEVAVGYRCSVCGMQLTVTHAQDAEITAPRHCREAMEPI